MLIETLQQYGLSEKESKVYLAGLGLGSSPGSTIARHAGENRVTVYSILKELVKRGIFTNLERQGITYFSPIPPDVLVRKLEDKYLTIKERLPEFMALVDKAGSKPKVCFFEGIEGIKQMYIKLLDSEVEIKSFLGLTGISSSLLQWLDNDFLPKRIKNNIHAKVILSGCHDNVIYHVKNDKKHKKQSISINKNDFNLECGIDLYGANKINILVLKEHEFLGLTIESREIYNTLVSLFNLVWNTYKNEK